MGIIEGILIFGMMLFMFFFLRTDGMRIQGYIFGLIVCLIWPISFFFVILLSPLQWKRLLKVIGVKTNDV